MSDFILSTNGPHVSQGIAPFNWAPQLLPFDTEARFSVVLFACVRKLLSLGIIFSDSMPCRKTCLYPFSACSGDMLEMAEGWLTELRARMFVMLIFKMVWPQAFVMKVPLPSLLFSLTPSPAHNLTLSLESD